MAVHPNRPSPQSSSSMPKPEPACRRRKSGRPKARLALAYEREARPGICAPPRLRAAGGDRGSPFGRIQLPKLAIEGGENLVDDAADQPQRMALGHSLFEVDIGKQFTRP